MAVAAVVWLPNHLPIYLLFGLGLNVLSLVPNQVTYLFDLVSSSLSAT